MARTEVEARRGPLPGEDRADTVLKDVGVELAKRLLHDMLLYRRFEERVEEAYALAKIGGFCHLHIGQEAIASGFIAPLRDDDYVVTAYRDHTQALAKGVDPKRVMAELYGRVDGCSGGKGGSMHMFDASKRFMGGWGIVGGQIPLAAGFAFAVRYRGGDEVVVCFLGDAAVNQGSFHESLNMSAVWDLPVIWVVENNEYGMGTAFHRVSETTVADKACSYGIPSSSINGQDVLEVFTRIRDLLEEVRDGGGPRYVEARTYRFKGHSMSDPVSGTYRSKTEVAERTSEGDPIAILRDRLMVAGALDQEEFEAIDKDVRSVVDEAADFADASPEPSAAALYEHAYARINEHGRLFFDGGRR